MIIRSKEYALTAGLSESEKELGVDLQLNADGDLVLNNSGDFNLILGASNAGQAIRIKLSIQPGGLVYHPSIGTNLQIGEKTKSAFAIKTQILTSLLKDPRFSNVDANVIVNGNVIIVRLLVTLANSGLEVPLQFSVV